LVFIKMPERMYNNLRAERKKPFAKRIAIFILAVFLITAIFLFFKVGKTFSLVSDNKILFNASGNNDDNYHESNRVDILLLGIRGDDDQEYGGDLADSIMLVSIDTKKEKVALISVPRDLYVKIPLHAGLREKINYAYAFGVNKGVGGLNLTKQVVESVTGIDIDYGVVVDFNTFKELIDAVGGVDVHLDKDFVESTQWGYEFRVPAGDNTLNGEDSLYYARSRFSSDDFDRARRQQQILVALKNKITSIGVLSNPLRLNEMFNTIGKGVKTNIDFATGLSMLSYAKYMDNGLKRLILDTTSTGLLQQGFVNNNYVLYPKAGLDDFSQIKEEVRNIFQ